MEKKQFEALYGEYFDKIYRFLFYRVFQKEIAEDLTSKTFLKALEHIDTFDPQKGQFSTWIFRIARNTLIDYWRREVPQVDIEEAWGLGEKDGVEEDLDRKAEAEKIKEKMRNLPQEQGEIVKMRVWDELSYKEISEVLGKTEGACKMAFSRAMQTLRSGLES